ncbi:MAG: TetR/AcrR family transcriptional regulator [Bacteroidia bacterium]|nr:TetR/AcrR family transcriptional regulator [Bacteroidia bacterium]
MSPRSTKQFEEIRENSRAKILDAAFELFARQGFHATSINQIAQQAGVAKGLIYNYFEKKEDLMHAIVLDGLQKSAEVMGTIQQAQPGKDRLRAMLEFTFRFLSEHAEYNRLMAALALQIQAFPELADIVTGKYNAMVPMLEEELTIAGHPYPERHAWMLAAILDGLGVQTAVLGNSLQLERLKQELIEEYCT